MVGTLSERQVDQLRTSLAEAWHALSSQRDLEGSGP